MGAAVLPIKEVRPLTTWAQLSSQSQRAGGQTPFMGNAGCRFSSASKRSNVRARIDSHGKHRSWLSFVNMPCAVVTIGPGRGSAGCASHDGFRIGESLARGGPGRGSAGCASHDGFRIGESLARCGPGRGSAGCASHDGFRIGESLAHWRSGRGTIRQTLLRICRWENKIAINRNELWVRSNSAGDDSAV